MPKFQDDLTVWTFQYASSEATPDEIDFAGLAHRPCRPP